MVIKMMLFCLLGLVVGILASTLILNYRYRCQMNDLNLKFNALSSEVSAIRNKPVPTSGTREFTQEEIGQLYRAMNLLPTDEIREREKSFVEIYSYDDKGDSSYGSASYLGQGYFLTVKHAVVALGTDKRKIASIIVSYKGRTLPAKIVDSGDAYSEVSYGDWAVLKVNEELDIQPVKLDLSYKYKFADILYRFGNDYSKGIIFSTGYAGHIGPNGLLNCLMDGHPGVSGGGVLNSRGDLVGIPVGRMQADYRYSFVLPIRKEMFRKVPDLNINGN